MSMPRELRLIKGFYPDGSPLVYRVCGKKHPKFGEPWPGFTWVQAINGEIIGMWFERLVTPIEGWEQAAWEPEACDLILRWSDSKPDDYVMKEDEVL